MHDFHYHDGTLHCEGVNLADLAIQHGTPLYVYSANTIQDHYRRLSSALSGLDHHIAFAVKANSNLSILKLLNDEGADFDIVSGGELFRVIKAGGTAKKCTCLLQKAQSIVCSSIQLSNVSIFLQQTDCG